MSRKNPERFKAFMASIQIGPRSKYEAITRWISLVTSTVGNNSFSWLGNFGGANPKILRFPDSVFWITLIFNALCSAGANSASRFENFGDMVRGLGLLNNLTSEEQRIIDRLEYEMRLFRKFALTMELDENGDLKETFLPNIAYFYCPPESFIRQLYGVRDSQAIVRFLKEGFGKFTFVSNLNRIPQPDANGHGLDDGMKLLSSRKIVIVLNTTGMKEQDFQVPGALIVEVKNNLIEGKLANIGWATHWFVNKGVPASVQYFNIFVALEALFNAAGKQSWPWPAQVTIFALNHYISWKRMVVNYYQKGIKADTVVKDLIDWCRHRENFSEEYVRQNRFTRFSALAAGISAVPIFLTIFYYFFTGEFYSKRGPSGFIGAIFDFLPESWVNAITSTESLGSVASYFVSIYTYFAVVTSIPQTFMTNGLATYDKFKGAINGCCAPRKALPSRYTGMQAGGNVDEVDSQVVLHVKTKKGGTCSKYSAEGPAFWAIIGMTFDDTAQFGNTGIFVTHEGMNAVTPINFKAATDALGGDTFRWVLAIATGVSLALTNGLWMLETTGKKMPELRAFLNGIFACCRPKKAVLLLDDADAVPDDQNEKSVPLEQTGAVRRQDSESHSFATKSCCVIC